MAQSLPTATRTEVTPAWKGRTVLLLCFVTIVFDGYDLVIFGSTIPSILKYQEWGLTTAQAGLIGSFALIGMLLGTMSVGILTDSLGRSRIM
jgi:AAHS family benzoate transporter-like MFS transporter